LTTVPPALRWCRWPVRLRRWRVRWAGSTPANRRVGRGPSREALRGRSSGGRATIPAAAAAILLLGSGPGWRSGGGPTRAGRVRAILAAQRGLPRDDAAADGAEAVRRIVEPAGFAGGETAPVGGRVHPAQPVAQVPPRRPQGPPPKGEYPRRAGRQRRRRLGLLHDPIGPIATERGKVAIATMVPGGAEPPALHGAIATFLHRYSVTVRVDPCAGPKLPRLRLVAPQIPEGNDTPERVVL
jgi:hypothetical protein